VRKFHLAVAALAFVLASCNGSVDTQESEKQAALQAEAVRQTGMPNITNFTEKKRLKEIYELRDRANLLTYTYIVDMQGKLHFFCESIGYGFPYGAQYSNPEKITREYGERYVMPQCEPNGLFMPDSAEASWVTMATPQGPQPIYVEERVLVSPVKLDLSGYETGKGVTPVVAEKP
jgi:hypothetical protein